MALLATCLVAAAVYWAFLRNDAPQASGVRAELDVARIENGPAPTNFDTGQPASVSHTRDDPGSNLVVRDGKLTFNPTKDGVAAAYFGTPDMSAPITGMGARWVFVPRADTSAGSVSMIVAHGEDSARAAVVPPVPVQFVVTPINWNLSIKRDNASPLEPIAAGSFTTPLAVDGSTAYEASVAIDGSVVTVNLPDGDRRTVNDARVAQWRGNYASFGLYSNNGLRDSVGGFVKVWASSAREGR